MKLIASLFCLAGLGLAAAAQNAGTAASPAVKAASPLPSPGAAVSVSVAVATPPGTADARRDTWLAEAAALKDAEVIEQGRTTSEISRMNTNVVVKGDVGGAVSLVAGSVFVLGHVYGPISVVGGDVTILGTASGPVSVVGGNLRVAGTIDGNASVVGGSIDRTSTAVISGNVSGAGGNFPFFRNGQFRRQLRGGLGKWFFSPRSFLFKAVLLAWWIAATAFAVVVMPGALETAATTLAGDPIRAAAIGLLFGIVFWFLVLISLILCFLLIGIPIVGLLIVIHIAVKWFGISVVSLWFGHLLYRRIGWTAHSLFAPMAVGVAALGVLRMIPGLGFFIWLIVSLMGAGIAMITVTRRSRVSAAPPVVPSQLSA